MESDAGPRDSGDRFPSPAVPSFASALVKGTFERYDPTKARFRTYLHTCLDGFAAVKAAALPGTKGPVKVFGAFDGLTAGGPESPENRLLRFMTPGKEERT